MTYVEGLDISHWQASTPSLVGKRFGVARASIGLLADDRFHQHISAFRKGGLVPMAYHFGDRRLDPVAQARLFLDVAGRVGFYFLDVEGRWAMGSAQIRAFFAEVRRQGHLACLYESLSGFPDHGQDINWIAAWVGGQPARVNADDFWQYRGSPLDLDRFVGTFARLQSLAEGLPDTSTPPPGGPAMSYINTTILKFGGRATIPAGKTFDAIKVDANGVIVERKTWTAHPTDRTFDYDASVAIDAAIKVTGNPFCRITSGELTGFLVSSAQVVEIPNAAPVDASPFTQADVDREVAKARAAGAADEWARIAKLLGH